MNANLAIKTIKSHNSHIMEAEKTGNVEALSGILSDTLLFRRANGSTTDKAGYLSSVKPGRFKYIFYEKESVQIEKDGKKAHCTLIVRGGTIKSPTNIGEEPAVEYGAWLNTRFFRMEDGRWRLYKWFNEALPGIQNLDERQKQVVAFLQKEYELKVNYLKDHFSRMWTRFNFFLTLETTLVGGKVYFINNLKEVVKVEGQPVQEWTSAPENTTLAVAGIIISLLWFFMSAQDSYLGRVYRCQAQEAGAAYRQWLDTNPGLTIIGDTSHSAVYAQFLSWRWEHISSTKLPALIALIAALCWAWSICI